MDALAIQLLNSSAGVAVKVLLENLMNATWIKNTEEALDIIEQLQDPEVERKFIEKHMSNALRMRTLHQREHDILLDDIYYPLTLRTASNNDEIIVGDGCTLHHSRIVNIVGVAGQGKSTILRKLFQEEIKKGARIPLFIELRRIENDGLLEFIKKTIESIGVDINRDSNHFELLLQSGKVVLMLDGFDEIKTSFRNEILASIKELNNRYNCSVIVTSRPETEICRETSINNLKVKALDQNAQFGILESLSEPHEYEEIRSVILSNPDLQETLSTPILINLLYVCYPYWDELPSNIVEFYSKLFITLYLKHDRMKSWARERKSSLNTDDSLWCFSAICYFSLVDEVFEFNTENLTKYAKKALHAATIDIAECEDFVDDIVNITCLIQQDGLDRFVFLHKSVQEYHAACTIRNFPEDLKRDFYNSLSETLPHTHKLDNVLNFLYFIDKSAYGKYVSLELFEKKGFIDLIDVDISFVCEFIKEKAKDLIIEFNLDESGVLGFKSMSSLSYNIGIEILPIMAGKPRIDHPERNIDVPILDDLDVLPLMSDLHEYNFKIIEPKNTNNKPTYVVQMDSFLSKRGILLSCAEILKKEVSEYYEKIYFPLKEESEKKARSIYREFAIRRVIP